MTFLSGGVGDLTWEGIDLCVPEKTGYLLLCMYLSVCYVLIVYQKEIS